MDIIKQIKGNEYKEQVIEIHSNNFKRKMLPIHPFSVSSSSFCYQDVILFSIDCRKLAKRLKNNIYLTKDSILIETTREPQENTQ